MIQRYDLIAVDLPTPESPNPAAAAAVQELMGGKFGEMSTLMNYTFQSFNFRGKEKYRPFYDLICNIAAEDTRTPFSMAWLASERVKLAMAALVEA